jgi:hypothetical protein
MGCEEGEGAIWNSDENYQDHLNEENVCEQCQQHFESQSNLENVC